MRYQFIDEIVFDGSTCPGTVELNGTKMSFETDDEAKFVFDLLNQQRDAVNSLIKVHRDLYDHLSRARLDYSVE